MVDYDFLSVYFYSVPNLRFREFNEQLIYTSFEKVIKLYRGSSPRPIINYVTTDENGINWIKIGDMPSAGNKVFSCSEKITKDGSKKSRAVYKGDIILSNSMSFGKPYILGIDGFIHDGWFVIRDYKKYLDKTYLCQLLSSDIVQNQYKSTAAGGGVKNISSDLVNSVKFHLPSIIEQRKIARFLESIDQRIETQIKIIEEYVILKNSLIHRFFTMDNPKVKLSTILTEINIKNKNKQIDTVLSVSNKLGFIKQSEQFEDREVASDDTSNYKIVNKGDYAYNPARINVGSIARLINYDKGIISPMYSCFKINEKKITYTYFDMFLSSFSFKRQLNKKLEGSVRQCLTFEGMLSMDIELPCIETQKSISNKIDMLNYKIKLESDYREALIKQKQFLLNNMFI